MTHLLSIVIAAALVNNVVLVQLLGVSSFFAYSNRLRNAMELALFSFLVLLGATICNLLLFRFILQPLGLDFLALFCFVIISAALSTGLVILVEKRFPISIRRHGLAFSLVAGNSAVIGSSLLNTVSLMNSLELIFYSLGTALGFALILIAFAALRIRLESAEVPDAFRGAPIQLISAGIMAMCLLGFAGLV